MVKNAKIDQQKKTKDIANNRCGTVFYGTLCLHMSKSWSADSSLYINIFYKSKDLETAKSVFNNSEIKRPYLQQEHSRLSWIKKIWLNLQHILLCHENLHALKYQS